MSALPAFSVPVAAVLLVLAALSFVTARRGWAGALARSGRLGLHSPAASASEEAFQIANRVAAPVVGGAAAIALILAVLVLVLPFAAAATVTLGVLGIAAVLVLLVAGGVLGEQAARAVPVPARRPQPSAACTGCACGGGGCSGLTRSTPTDGSRPATTAQGTPAG